MSQRLVLMLLMAALVSAPVFAQESDQQDDPAVEETVTGETGEAVDEPGDRGEPVESERNVQGIGEELVNQLWADVEAGNLTALEECAGECFQAIHEDGMKDISAELSYMRSADLGDYLISGVNVTGEGSMLVATYFITKRHTVVGEVVSSDPIAILSAWEEVDGQWHWIAQATLKNL
jgi:hypothetical protein